MLRRLRMYCRQHPTLAYWFIGVLLPVYVGLGLIVAVYRGVSEAYHLWQCDLQWLYRDRDL